MTFFLPKSHDTAGDPSLSEDRQVGSGRQRRRGSDGRRRGMKLIDQAMEKGPWAKSELRTFSGFTRAGNENDLWKDNNNNTSAYRCVPESVDVS